MIEQIIYNCLFSILSGFIIYFSLILIKQNWVSTLYYFITFLLLPPIAFVITSVISNNLALSLGMIGALSIIRFRNPVKNPLELVIFFGLLTIGISFGVNPNWGILLTSIIIAILIFSRIFQILIEKYDNINFFRYSFAINDGSRNHLVEIESSNKVNFLESHRNLIFSSSSNNKFFYKISINTRKELDNLKKLLETDKNITNIEIQYGD